LKLFLENPHLFEYYSIVIALLALFGATFWVEKMLSWRKWLGIALLTAPVLYFFLLLDAYTVNIPYTDDFNLLETVLKIRQADSFSDAIKALFEQVNQHRFAFERIVMLIMVLFTGTVNIKTQIFIGNLFLLGISYLLFKALKKEQVSWYYFIPVPYVLFNLVYFENAYWGIAALQNTPLIFFAMLSAYGLARNDSKGLYLGIAAALLTTFTSGSGLLTWIIGLVILCFQKRFKLAIWWLLAMVAVLLFYFLFDYYFIPSQGDKVWKHPIFNTISIFGFWGNALYLDVRHPLVPAFHKDLIACVLLGAGIAALFATWTIRLLIRRKPVWSDWFLLGALMFVMGTGAMFVISRPINNYLMYGGNVFSRRYMTFGVAILATAYICLIICLKDFKSLKRLAVTVAVLGFVLLNFVSYYLSVVQIRKLHDELVLDSYFWKNYSTFLTVGDKFSDIPFWNHPTRMRDLIRTLESTELSDFYRFHNIPDHQKLINQTATSGALKGEFDAVFDVRNGESNLPMRYYKFQFKPADDQKGPFYFVLQSSKHSIVLPAVPAPNTLSDFLQKTTYYGDVYRYSLYKPKLPAGTYKAWIMSRSSSGSWESVYTGKHVLFY
jgi:hypothetical protein